MDVYFFISLLVDVMFSVIEFKLLWFMLLIWFWWILNCLFVEYDVRGRNRGFM